MTIKPKIVSIDYELASGVISNNALTAFLDTSDEWITTRTGIKERRIASSNETPTTLGIEAARKVIKRAACKGFDKKRQCYT